MKRVEYVKISKYLNAHVHIDMVEADGKFVALITPSVTNVIDLESVCTDLLLHVMSQHDIDLFACLVRCNDSDYRYCLLPGDKETAPCFTPLAFRFSEDKTVAGDERDLLACQLMIKRSSSSQSMKRRTA